MTDLYNEIYMIFQFGDGETFRDGYDSVFSRDITTMIQEHGNDALGAIDTVLLEAEFYPDVLGEVFEVIGHIDSDILQAERLEFLIKHLGNEHAQIRDSIGSGIASMDCDDLLPELLGKAIAALSKAIEVETIKWNKKQLPKVREQLRQSLGE